MVCSDLDVVAVSERDLLLSFSSNKITSCKLC